MSARRRPGPTVGLKVADATRRRRLIDRLSSLGALVVRARAAAEADIVITDRSEDRIDQATIFLGEDWANIAAGDFGDMPLALLPDEPSQGELALAMSALGQGLCLMPRKLIGDLLERASGPAQLGQPDEEACEARLSGREREVLAILVDGGSNKAIARSLDVSIHTAKFHVASLRDKLNARGRADIVAIALRRGLVAL